MSSPSRNAASPRRSPTSTPTRRINIGRFDGAEVEKFDSLPKPFLDAPKAKDRAPPYLAIMMGLMVVVCAGGWTAVTGRLDGLERKMEAIQSEVLVMKESMAQFEKALDGKPSTEQITNRFSHPVTQIIQRLEQIERNVHIATTAPNSPSTPVGTPAGKSTRKKGTVEITFIFEPKEKSGANAKLLWLGRQGMDEKFTEGSEKAYTELPRGMRFVQTTLPGECWRARDAATSDILLDKHCATSVDEEVRIY